jgi:hypothetical protein
MFFGSSERSRQTPFSPLHDSGSHHSSEHLFPVEATNLKDHVVFVFCDVGVSGSTGHSAKKCHSGTLQKSSKTSVEQSFFAGCPGRSLKWPTKIFFLSSLR